MLSPSGSSSSPLPGAASSRSSSPSTASSSSPFLAAVFFAAVFLATVFLAAVFFTAAFLATAFLGASSASSAGTSMVSDGTADGTAEAATVLVVVTVVLAATVLVAVRFAGLFAATLLRVRFGDSAALTISVTPSSSRIWLRLRRTFFHWVGGIWSASKARRTSSPAICPSAFPRSMSAITDSDSAISGGSVRDVLADTNNLSKRWKTASGPAQDRAGADDHRLGMCRGRGLNLGAAQRHAWPLYSFLGCYLLSHRMVPRSVTRNLRGPSHTPKGTKGSQGADTP